ncbi:MAG: IS1380 family transposase [Desulfuromonadales bacterium]|nr:IS1380 family transposase [Desulfuromonadales bacterium]
MSNDTTSQGVLFEQMADRPVAVRFDQAHSSSDGGSLLLKALDERLGLSSALSGCLRDGRQASKVQHDLQTLLRQRLFGIACGHADGNDAAGLAEDPVHKMLVDRDPLSGRALASQPTLSRFENTVGPKELIRLAEALAETVIRRHRRRKRSVDLITLDFDPTHDPAHGQQQLSLFNWVYDTRCYLPLAGFVSFDDEAEQYLVAYVLRAGNAPAKQGLLGVLDRLLPRLRAAFPKARIRIRLDAGFVGNELYDYFEANHLEYVVCMAKNPVLQRHAEPLLEPLRQAVAGGETPQATFSECMYRAGPWTCNRRVIIKAAIALHPGRTPKDNPRFVVTNLNGDPQKIYEQIYCARGDAENRIKELKDGLQIDRTSCTSFHANQFRALITAAAYVLMQELRLQARHTSCAKAQVSTLRLRLLKLGAWVERSVRRIVIHLPMHTPHAKAWHRIARSVGALPT